MQDHLSPQQEYACNSAAARMCGLVAGQQGQARRGGATTYNRPSHSAAGACQAWCAKQQHPHTQPHLDGGAVVAAGDHETTPSASRNPLYTPDHMSMGAP